MAYAITNKEHSLSFISKDQNELSCQFPGYAMYQNGTAGYCFEISNDDFIKLQTLEKQFSYDQNQVTLVDFSTPVIFSSEQQLKDHIKMILDSLNQYLPKHISNSFGTELQAYKTLVENFDTSSLTYPTNVSFERHLLNLGHPIISTLQMV